MQNPNSLYDFYIILKDLFDTHQASITITGVIASIIIEKSKSIKINPWSFVGNLLTGDVMDKVYKSQGDLEERVFTRLDNSINDCNLKGERRAKKLWDAFGELKKDLEYKIDANNYDRARADIFRFAEGIRKNVNYTKEHWNGMRDLCLRYKQFCKRNSRFINSQCEDAIRLIEDTWVTKPWENE